MLDVVKYRKASIISGKIPLWFVGITEPFQVTLHLINFTADAYSVWVKVILVL